jgi:hypothetical protein
MVRTTLREAFSVLRIFVFLPWTPYYLCPR